MEIPQMTSSDGTSTLYQRVVSHGEIAAPQVLLVDPDAAGASQRRDWLRDGGYDVAHAANSASAIEHLPRLRNLGLVVCNVRSESPSTEVLRASRALRPTVPVLLLVDDHAAVPYVSAESSELLRTPFGPSELLARVDGLLPHARRGGRGTRTVLAIGAHPDDAEIGVGATLLQHAAAGDRIVHLLMTDGEAGGDPDLRVAEAAEAARRMRATLLRARMPDAYLSEARSTVSVIESAVREFSPSVVYVHSANDSHQDHRYTHTATMVATREVSEVYCYQSPSSTIGFAPARFVDVGRFIDAKVAMLQAFGSQASIRDYLAEDVIRSTARYWGRHAGHRLVEPLEIVRQVAVGCYAFS
jgi:LmbE family N-acetylglucosaminyl deacetylase